MSVKREREMNIGSVAVLAGMVACALLAPISAAESAEFRERVLYSFCSQQNCADGAAPFASLIDVKGTLYGTTMDGGAHGEGGGTVFALDPDTGTEKVVYSFCGKKHCADGRNPLASLIDVKGTLYGMTSAGGAHRQGAVVALDPKTGVEKVLHSFCSEKNCTDGFFPWGSLIDVKGTLYGTTSLGGQDEAGTVIAVDANTGVEKVLHSFCSQEHCTDGGIPLDGFIDINGTMYGTSFSGGAADEGTVFAIDPHTGAESVIYPFCEQKYCPDGDGPEDGLIDVNGVFYGTTEFGGAYGYGSVFSLDPSTGVETVVYSFCILKYCADGYGPIAGLIDVNGRLYGTTLSGGAHEKGTVFAIDPNTNTETVVYSFCKAKNCPDGSGPEAGLIEVNGVLYSTTVFGGSDNGGTVFALTTKREALR
jgi:uncharacterized repeat protein (TIGR03803 family)